MSRYDSIQDFLLFHGYVIDGEYFRKQPFDLNVSLLAGHTVQSFTALAKQKGWIEEEKRQEERPSSLASLSSSSMLLAGRESSSLQRNGIVIPLQALPPSSIIEERESCSILSVNGLRLAPNIPQGGWVWDGKQTIYGIPGGEAVPTEEDAPDLWPTLPTDLFRRKK